MAARKGCSLPFVLGIGRSDDEGNKGATKKPPSDYEPGTETPEGEDVSSTKAAARSISSSR